MIAKITHKITLCLTIKQNQTRNGKSTLVSVGLCNVILLAMKPLLRTHHQSHQRIILSPGIQPNGPKLLDPNFLPPILCKSCQILKSQPLVLIYKQLDGVLISEEVGRCVEESMSGPRSQEFRKNEAELKIVTREAMGDGGSSDTNLQMFLKPDHFKCKRLASH